MDRGRDPRLLSTVGFTERIDDATGRIFVRFYKSETTEAYMDLLWRYIRKFGRPLIWYSDRAGIFRADGKVAGYDEKQRVPTQFSRALSQLDMQMILANSPQAKGRIERLWGTLQKRWTREFRRAKVCTMAAANELIETTLQADHNRRFAITPASPNEAHRTKKDFDLPGIFSHQETRCIRNDYTIQYDNHLYQLSPPVIPGQRGGLAIIEERLDGTTHIKFKNKYLRFTKIKTIPVGQPNPMDNDLKVEALGGQPPNEKASPSLPRSLSLKPFPAEPKKDRAESPARPTVQWTAERSLRTPAEPCPSGGRRVVVSRATKVQCLPVHGVGS